MLAILLTLFAGLLALLIGCIGDIFSNCIISLWDGVLSVLFGTGGLIFEAINNGSHTAGMWNTAVQVASGIETGAAISLTVVFIYADLIQASASLIDMKRAEHIFKSFIRACITIWIVSNSTRLLLYIFQLFLGLADFIPGMSGAGIQLASVDLGLNTTIDSLTSSLEGFGATVLQTAIDAMFGPLLVLLLLIISFILCVYTLVSCTIDIIMRWVRLILHIAIAPLALCTIASKQFSFIGKQFLKSFCGVSLEIFFCALIYRFCGVIYNTLYDVLVIGNGSASSPDGVLTAAMTATSDAALTCATLLVLCMTFLVFNTSIKKVGQLTAGLTGLQAGN